MTELGGAVKAAWQRFLDDYEPLRPTLYRYCRHLTGSPWDAEDLAQDALARAFVTLGCLTEPPANPRAWLFRVASNLWINHVRRPKPRREDVEAAAVDPRATREAAGTLLAQLAPQERAAVVLKDVFDFSLDEIAEALATTTGAIKAALHRGRGKLVEPEASPREVDAGVLDAFCAAFNARDLDGMTALLTDGATVSLPGLVVQRGPAAAKAGIFRGTLFGCPMSAGGALPPMRASVVDYRGEPILLWWWGDEVDTVVRVEGDGARIAGLTSYYHAPEVMAEICNELDVRYRDHGHRYWQGAQ